jgi:hypothetical protein
VAVPAASRTPLSWKDRDVISFDEVFEKPYEEVWEETFREVKEFVRLLFDSAVFLCELELFFSCVEMKTS